jgi:hypothetical protein
MAACGSAGAETVEVSEAAKTIRPGTGTAGITFRAPAGAISVPIRLRSKTSSVELTQVFALGVAAKVPAGDYCVWTEIGGFRTQEACNVTVQAGAAAIYDLGAVRFSRSRGEAVLGLDLSLGNIRCYPSRDIGTVSGIEKFLAKTNTVVPHAPGHFTYAYVERLGDHCAAVQAASSYAFTVSAATTAAVDLNDTTGVQAIRLVPPASRAFAGSWSGDNGMQLSLSLADGATAFTSLGDKPVLLRVDMPATLEVAFPGTSHSLVSVPSAASTTAIPELAFERLDIEAPLVTLADGSQVTIDRARVTVRSPGRAYTGARFMLPGGLDLPAGSYEVIVSYTHPTSGQPVEETQTVSLP